MGHSWNKIKQEILSVNVNNLSFYEFVQLLARKENEHSDLREEQ